jgi:hypothetical protein
MLTHVPWLRRQLQIASSIVVLDLVLMMHDLGRKESTAELLLHDETMFTDVSAFGCVWVIWDIDIDITIGA